MKIAHLADTHLGYRYGQEIDDDGRNQRGVDFERAFKAAILGIETEKPDLVIHAGDVFHQTKPSWQSITVFIDGMRRLQEAGIPVVVIAGNHDMPRLRQSATVFDVLQAALPGVTIVAGWDEGVIFFAHLGCSVWCYPHGALVSGIKPAFFPDAGDLNILVTHGFPKNLAVGGGAREAGEQRIDEGVLADQWDYVALGHWHEFRQVRSNAWFSGSTERCGYSDEAAVPGWARVELAKGRAPKVEHVEVPARPMVSLDWVDGTGLDAAAIVGKIQRQLYRDSVVGKDIEGAIVRARIRNCDPRRGKAVEMRLKEIGVESHCFSFRVDTTKGKEPPKLLAQATPVPKLDIGGLFREYAAGRRFDAALGEGFPGEFLERGLSALDRAQERADNAAVEV